MWGHRGGLGTWIPVRGQFSVVLACRKGGESPGIPRALFLPSFLPFALAQPFRLPSLAPWLCPAACPGSWGLSLHPAPCRCPLCRRCPDGGRAHPAPPSLRSQLLVSPDLARSVPGCGWRWGHHTGRGVPPWGYLHGPFVLGSHHSPSPRRFMRCLADGCWIRHPVPSVLVSPRRNPHLHPKQG